MRYHLLRLNTFSGRLAKRFNVQVIINKSPARYTVTSCEIKLIVTSSSELASPKNGVHATRDFQELAAFSLPYAANHARGIVTSVGSPDGMEVVLEHSGMHDVPHRAWWWVCAVLAPSRLENVMHECGSCLGQPCSCAATTSSSVEETATTSRGVEETTLDDSQSSGLLPPRHTHGHLGPIPSI